MKNTVKFFLGGAVAAAFILGVFAFTNKQTENKPFFLVRIIERENHKGEIQICDENGKLQFLQNLTSGKFGGIDSEGANTKAISLTIKYYKDLGYEIKEMSTSNPIGLHITTLIFEK